MRLKGTPEFARRIIRDTKLTVVAGLAMGMFFCLIALVIFLFRGHRPFDANHVSVVRLLGAYLVAGGLGGLIVGFTLPLTRWMPGAALVAFLGMFVLWFVVGLSMSPQDPLRTIVHTSAVLGAAFGVPIGVGFWIQNRLYQRTGRWY